MKSYLLATGLNPDETEYASANIAPHNKVEVLIEEENAPYTYVGKSATEGLGLFAARDILKDDLVIDYSLFPENWYKLRYDELSEEQIRKNWYVMVDNETCITSDKYSKFSYINHSRKPNCDWEIRISKIIANRDIKKGEELFIDYRKEPRPNRVVYPEWI